MRIFRNSAIMFVFAIVTISIVGCGNQDDGIYPYLSIYQAKLQPASTIAPVGSVMAFSNIVVNYCGSGDYANISINVRADKKASKSVLQPLLIKKSHRTINDPMAIEIIGSGEIFNVDEIDTASYSSHLTFTIYNEQMCEDIELTLAGKIQIYSAENPGKEITLDIVSADIYYYSAYDANIKLLEDMPILGVYHTTTATPFYDIWE